MKNIFRICYKTTGRNSDVWVLFTAKAKQEVDRRKLTLLKVMNTISLIKISVFISYVESPVLNKNAFYIFITAIKINHAFIQTSLD